MNTVGETATREGLEKQRFLLSPSRTDFLFRALTSVVRPHPVVVGISYFFISFVMVYIIGFVTGQLDGKNGLAPMYAQVMDNFNLAFLAPIGAGLLCNLYNSISAGFTYLYDEKIVPENQTQDYMEFLAKLERWYNHLAAVVVFFSASLAINLFNYFGKQDSWLGVNGGITGIYGRVFIFFNFFIIGLTFYKFVITVIAVRQLFDRFDLIIQPMHPDRAGGLEPIGRVAIAVTSLVGLVMAFFAILLVFDQFSAGYIVYRLIFFVFYVSSPYFFFATLSKANKTMMGVKELALERLRLTFEEHYNQLSAEGPGKPYDLGKAEDIAKVHRLYELVEGMPVWPFDTRSVVRFFSVFVAPVALYVLDFVIGNFDALRGSLGW